MIEDLSEAFSEIYILINNAGNAHGLDTFQEASTEDWDVAYDGY
jgi:3-hydroxy acid dehydrogenase/malonic semialdehyde reductase